MQNIPNNEVSEICDLLGESPPKNISQIVGGDIHQSWKIEFQNSKFFLKRNERNKKFLKFEKSCLNNLQKYVNNENLVIPRVIFYVEINSVELLLMEWIDMNNTDQKKLGKGLGEMHIQSNKFNPERFGYPTEGFIGTTNQIIGWEKNWNDCFINLRIDPQLSFLKVKFLDIETKKKIKAKIQSELIKHKPFNSLVHGDLWSGNIGVNQKNQGVIFDPSCWWADSEVDIAMTTLFGNFKSEFYENYHKVNPIKNGFEKRAIIYNFYHILNHANMFGGSYLYQVQDYIKKIINM